MDPFTFLVAAVIVAALTGLAFGRSWRNPSESIPDIVRRQQASRPPVARRRVNGVDELFVDLGAGDA
jgi:hypothetical protein